MESKKGIFSRPGKSWKMTVVMETHGIPPIGHGIFNHFRGLTKLVSLVGNPFC